MQEEGEVMRWMAIADSVQDLVLRERVCELVRRMAELKSALRDLVQAEIRGEQTFYRRQGQRVLDRGIT